MCQIVCHKAKRLSETGETILDASKLIVLSFGKRTHSSGPISKRLVLSAGVRRTGLQEGTPFFIRQRGAEEVVLCTRKYIRELGVRIEIHSGDAWGKVRIGAGG